MRYMIFALLAAMSVPLCQRRNPHYCDSSTPCENGRRCLMFGPTGVGRCQPEVSVERCSVSSTCGAENPICDATSGTCRPCLPGEDELCRGHSPRTGRCEAPRCVECGPTATSVASAECAALSREAPICDKDALSCRPCLLHAECESGVCAKDERSARHGLPKGSCVPRDQVLVIDQSACTAQGPVFCTPTQAIARMDEGHRYLLVKRSGAGMENNFSNIEIGINPQQKGIELYVIGPQADSSPGSLDRPPPARIGGVSGTRGLVVLPKTRVTVEGMLIDGSSIGIDCLGDPFASGTEIHIERSVLAGNGTAISVRSDCYLDIRQSWIGKVPPRGTFPGLSANHRAIFVQESDFNIESTIINDNGLFNSGIIGGIHVDRLGRRPLSRIVSSTFYGQLSRQEGGAGRYYLDLLCRDVPQGRIGIMNSLFLRDGGYPWMDEHIAPACGAERFSLASDDRALSDKDGVSIEDAFAAGLRDAMARDFRLIDVPETAAQRKVREGGALSAVVTTTGGHILLLPPARDIAGRERPVSAGRTSIGAYEPD